MSTNTVKTAVIGWDSASFEIIAPLLEKGQLPNLQKLMARGGYGTLYSTVHPLTPTAWTSFMTGANPGRHGIFDFVRLAENGQFQLNTGAAIGYPTLWSRLSNAGKSVGVINVPMTYPPESVNGFLIAGMDAPIANRASTFPAELSAEIHKQFGQYRVKAKVQTRQDLSVDEFTDKYVDDLVAMTWERAETALHQLRKGQPDFFMTVFITPDRVQHALGKLMAGDIKIDDGIGRVYKACDDALGQIMDMLSDNTNVFVMSDHGGCAYSDVFELSTWLSQQGIMVIQPPSRLEPVLEFWRKVKRNIRRRLGLPVTQRLGLQSFQDRIVWSKTKAFSIGAFGNIYLNRADRFPWGTIPADQIEPLIQTITEQLLALKTADGRSIVKAVHRATETYQGTFTSLAPDLLVETEEDFFVRNNLDHDEGKIIYPAGIYGKRSLEHTGRHTMRGFLIAAGPQIENKGEQPEKTEIIDLAPTILYLHGQSVPSSIDGRVLTGWVSKPFQENNAPHYFESDSDSDAPRDDASYTDDEILDIEDHLRALGYIE